MKCSRIAAYCLTVVLIFAAVPGVSVPASAESEVMPFWTNVSSVTAALSFSGSAANGYSANCTGRIIGLSGTTHIAAAITLYRKNANNTYTYVDTWSDSVNGTSLTITGSHAATAGTYKLTVTATVTRNGTAESVSNSAERTLS